MTAHTPVPGAQSDLHPVVINCVKQCTSVRRPEEHADLKKVTTVPGSPNFILTKTGVEEGESFNTDMTKMITMWDSMEKDEDEWKVEEGVRRGGRRVSRRISELLKMFEGNEQTDVSKTSTDVIHIQNLISHTRGRGSGYEGLINISNLKKIDVVTEKIPSCDMTGEVDCDWPTGITIENLSTNERLAGEQVDRER